ncbi:MAG: tRNA 2-thiocytidine biosynthesis protein TtcA [Methanoregula sp. PtaU1.Bin051]|nr:MAG: tRNA 2-thiocytidine biosynthesis protein TtcA [Methanoregula sp. PtaU1.Bin051]
MATSDPGNDGRIRCALCNELSVIRLRDRNRQLCAEHFAADLSERVRETITSHAMIAPGDRIAVAFSGGKDSTALLLLLRDLVTASDDITLVAITVDEGIAGYRSDTIRSAESLAEELGIEQVIVSFSGLFGKDLDAILESQKERACSICGILRRKALLSAAQAAGATKIATGHNLDDEAQSVLMNALRGDLARLVRDSSSRSGDCFIPRIKPLKDISEKEIAVFLMARGRFPELPECPYTRYALRAEIRSRLSSLEYRHPGTMKRLVSGKERLTSVLDGIPLGGAINRCRECGEPCSGTVCQTCQLIASLL